MSVSPRIFDPSEMEPHERSSTGTFGMENENNFEVPRLTLDDTTKLGTPGV